MLNNQIKSIHERDLRIVDTHVSFNKSLKFGQIQTFFKQECM